MDGRADEVKGGREQGKEGGDVRKGFRWSDAMGVAHGTMAGGRTQLGEFRAK